MLCVCTVCTVCLHCLYCLSVLCVCAVCLYCLYCLSVLSVCIVCLYCTVYTVCLYCLSVLSVYTVCLCCLSILSVCLSVCLYCFLHCVHGLSAVTLCMHWVFNTAPLAKCALGPVYRRPVADLVCDGLPSTERMDCLCWTCSIMCKACGKVSSCIVCPGLQLQLLPVGMLHLVLLIASCCCSSWPHGCQLKM